MINRKLTYMLTAMFFLLSIGSKELKAGDQISADPSQKGAKALFETGEGPTVLVERTHSGGIIPIDNKGKTKPNNIARKSKIEKYMGISYWFELVRDDGSQFTATAKDIFRSGDKIKMHLKSNKDGYLYVVNIGSTGTCRTLFPKKDGTNNFVKALEVYVVPADTYMKFDENPGEETLLVLLSPNPLADLFPYSPGTEAKESMHFANYAEARGAKDIVLEDDIASGINKAQYAVAPMTTLQNGKAISLFIKLRHK